MNSRPSSVVRFAVSRAEDAAKLVDVLAARLGQSQRAAKALLDRRLVWVNRQCVWMARHALRAGDVVEARAAAPGAVVRPLRLLAEDEHYAVVDKPAGSLATGPDSVEERARRQFEEPALRAVHRLDRDTSGCLLLARSDAAYAAVVERFRTRRVLKAYHLIVWGRMDRRHSTIVDPVDGAPARTHLTLLLAGDEATLALARIETGRTHQIRIHLAARRHPVLGDREHGLKSAADPRLRMVPRQMLHASDLSFDHPLAPGRFQAHSPLPADFRRCLQLFGLGKPQRGRGRRAAPRSGKRP